MASDTMCYASLVGYKIEEECGRLFLKNKCEIVTLTHVWKKFIISLQLSGGWTFTAIDITLVFFKS